MTHRPDTKDDLELFVDEQLEDPEFRAAYEDAQVRSSLLRQFFMRRKVRKISQLTVARRMGTTQSAVSELENGGGDPRLSTLQRYARAIGCRLAVELKDDGGGWRFPGQGVFNISNFSVESSSAQRNRLRARPASSWSAEPAQMGKHTSDIFDDIVLKLQNI